MQVCDLLFRSLLNYMFKSNRFIFLLPNMQVKCEKI